MAIVGYLPARGVVSILAAGGGGTLFLTSKADDLFSYRP